MATTKPRITITLEPRQHEVLRSISDSSGQSMSSLLVEFIESTMPVLERMAVTFQKLKDVKLKERQHMAKALDDAQSAFEPLALSAVNQFDMFMGNVEMAAGVSGDALMRTPETPAASGSSPSTNRGVTPTHSKHRKPAPIKAKKAVSDSPVLKK